MTTPSTTLEPLRSVGELVALLHRSATFPDTDRVGVLDHGLQCAAELRRRRPDDLELQVAGLVHDLGHVAGDVEAHGRVGRALLEPLLGERVGALVELHVPAKRYLVTAEDTYRAGLSPVSIATLAEQGGPMTPDEVAAFEAEPHHLDAVELRRADEAAKVPGRIVPGLDEWKPRLEALAAAVRERR